MGININKKEKEFLTSGEIKNIIKDNSQSDKVVEEKINASYKSGSLDDTKKEILELLLQERPALYNEMFTKEANLIL